LENRVCLRCNEVFKPRCPNHKFCDECRLIKHKERGRNSSLKFRIARKVKFSKEWFYHKEHHLSSSKCGCHNKWVNKRTFPRNCKCELCGRVNYRLMYHHWGEVKKTPDLTLGIWVCKKCHDYVEIIEHPEHFNTTVANYILLKGTIENADACLRKNVFQMA
jgi:hypothetical protein